MSKIWAKILAFSAIVLAVVSGYGVGLLAPLPALAFAVAGMGGIIACVALVTIIVRAATFASGLAISFTAIAFACATLAGAFAATALAVGAVGYAFAAGVLANKAVNDHYTR